jgi:pimeloyl-ACP methyl ester carboxylesterase
VRRRTVTTPDGRPLDVHEGGDPRGVAVVAIYGTPSGGLIYEQHSDEAARQGIRLVSWARPGYAGSDPQPGRTVADVVPDAGAVADALGIERFGVWGVSGGGPHALALAALLPDRVPAAASLAGVAPWEAEGLDYLDGMGEANLEEFAAVLEGRTALEPLLQAYRTAFATATGADLRREFATLLSEVDAAVASDDLADHLVGTMQAGLAHGVDGWADDDLAFVAPWGFDLDAIAVPVLIWHGEHDRFVPTSHGRWLAARVPGAEARISAEDGHLTLMAHRVGEVHDWLLERLV